MKIAVIGRGFTPIHADKKFLFYRCASVCISLNRNATVGAGRADDYCGEAEARHSNSQRYEGTLEVIGAENRWRQSDGSIERIGSFGNSKAILRFTAPPEVKGVSLLIVNHPERPATSGCGGRRSGGIRGSRCRTGRRDFSERISALKIWRSATSDQYDYKLAGEENGAVEDRIAAAEIVAIHVHRISG